MLNTKPGSYITYACDLGYTSDHGPTSLLCDKDYKWSGNFTCQSKWISKYGKTEQLYKIILLDEIEHDSENYQGWGLCYNVDLYVTQTSALIILTTMWKPKPNPIIIINYYYNNIIFKTLIRASGRVRGCGAAQFSQTRTIPKNLPNPAQLKDLLKILINTSIPIVFQDFEKFCRLFPGYLPSKTIENQKQLKQIYIV